MEKETFKIVYNTKEERYHIEEYIGEPPIKYECASSFCWRDCVPCSHCECSKEIITDREQWNIWKERNLNKKSIPCSKKYNDHFTDLRLKNGGLIDKNHFGILNGEAVPIQLELNF